jgi:hypothetical protein
MSKTLLIAAAALAGSVISSQAQVYSQNIVGYVNLPLTTGYTALANQLDIDGTGTNNTVATVFGTNLVSGTLVFAWDSSTSQFVNAEWLLSKGVYKWIGSTNAVSAALNPGVGVLVQSPSTNNITLVGTVLQGTNLISLTTGYNLVSSVAPISGDLVTNLGYAAQSGDFVFLFNPATQQYVDYEYLLSKGVLKWLNGAVPQISVGQAFFIKTTGAETWTNVFTSN